MMHEPPGRNVRTFFFLLYGWALPALVPLFAVVKGVAGPLQMWRLEEWLLSWHTADLSLFAHLRRAYSKNGVLLRLHSLSAGVALFCITTLMCVDATRLQRVYVLSSTLLAVCGIPLVPNMRASRVSKSWTRLQANLILAYNLLMLASDAGNLAGLQCVTLHLSFWLLVCAGIGERFFVLFFAPVFAAYDRMFSVSTCASWVLSAVTLSYALAPGSTSACVWTSAVLVGSCAALVSLPAAPHTHRPHHAHPPHLHGWEDDVHGIPATGAAAGALIPDVPPCRVVPSTLDSVHTEVSSHIEFSTNREGVPICTLLPGSHATHESVQLLCTWLRAELMSRYNEKGVIVLRGFPLSSWEAAEQAFMLVAGHRVGGGPLGWMPSHLQRFLKELIMRVMVRLLDPRRKGGLRALAAPSRAVQGPHQEASFCTWRAPTVGFYCETAPMQYGETALFDAAAAYRSLSDTLKAKCKRLSFSYDMEAGILSRILPGYLFSVVSWFSYLLYNQPSGWVPLVVRAPASGEACQQWFGFGERLSKQAAKAFNKRFPGRDVCACSDYWGQMHVRPNKAFIGRPKLEGSKLTEEDEAAITEAFFANASLHAWQEGDLLLLDNIRWAHGRCNGEPPRMVHFFQAEPLVKISHLGVCE